MEKYLVTLTAEERERLEAIVSKGSYQSQKVINALILLNFDTSSGRVRRSGQEVAAVLHVSARKIDRGEETFRGGRLRSRACQAAEPKGL